jgi:hypothetical protein
LVKLVEELVELTLHAFNVGGKVGEDAKKNANFAAQNKSMLRREPMAILYK